LEKVKRVLIYRLGSLGDTVVALPCFHQIAKSFPNAERKVLTNWPVNLKAPPLDSILKGSGLVDGYIRYPLGTRNIQDLLKLYKIINQWEPELLIYLAAFRTQFSTIRDYLFFRLCGIKQIIGLPLKSSLHNHQWLPKQQRYAYEAELLAKRIELIGIPDLDKHSNWDLLLTEKEKFRVQELSKEQRFFVCGIGTKWNTNDWGIRNWKNLIKQFQDCHPDYGVIFVGAAAEKELVEQVRATIRGLSFNFCGVLTPRESWGMMRSANFYLGVDSGPMHLAASAGIPCVSIFSARNKPGIWFPYGNKHEVLYHQTECYNCKLNKCIENNKKCINSISVEEVMEAIENVLVKLT
jgi:heptosyltransferase-3